MVDDKSRSDNFDGYGTPLCKRVKVKPDPGDFFPSPSENLAPLVPGEMFNFTQPVCGLPGGTFTSLAGTAERIFKWGGANAKALA